jgi:hypothetical protein
MIHFNCPTCGKAVRVDGRQAGLTLRCPRCTANIHVPDAGDGPESQRGEVVAVRRGAGIAAPEAGIPPDLREEIPRHPDPAEFCSRQEPRHQAGTAGGEPPGSEAPKEASSYGRWSLILGVAAISWIGLWFLLFLLALVLIVSAGSGPYYNRLTFTSGITTLVVALGFFCFGSVLALPGMALGLASLAQRGRSSRAGVAGCWINGLILGVGLCLLAATLLFGGNRRGPQGYYPPPPGYNGDYPPDSPPPGPVPW